MTRDDAKDILQLVFVFVSLLCSLGDTRTVYYQYAVRFLYEEDCKNCLDVCAQRISQCANLEFHYFNVTVRRTVPNCSAREMLLMLELQQMDRKNGDSVYLEACISGMNKYRFWNNLACNTVMKGGGRGEDLISCRPNEILSPGGSSTSVSDVPTWAYVVFGILSMAVVILLLLLCVVLSVVIWCYRNNNGRANGQGRDPERYQQLDPSPAPSWVARLKQWAINRHLVEPRWGSPTPRPPPSTVDFERPPPTVDFERPPPTVDFERPRPRGASSRSEEQAHVQGGVEINT